MKKNYLLITTILTLSINSLSAQIIAITGLNSDDPDGFSFVALTTIPNSQKLYFTDYNYVAANNNFQALFGGTSIVEYTPPSGGLNAGDIIFISETSSNIFTTIRNGLSSNTGNTILNTGTFTFTPGGETLYGFTSTNNADPANNIENIHSLLDWDEQDILRGDPRLDNDCPCACPVIVVNFNDGLGDNVDYRNNGGSGNLKSSTSTLIFTNISNWFQNSGTSQTLESTPSFSNIQIGSDINPATGTDTRTECDSYTWIDGNTYIVNNNSATFNIVGGAANGCDSLVTLALTINSVSDITTGTSGITISANNTGATYQWLDCNNNYAIIPSETGQSFAATANGNYAAELIENGCTDTTACIAISAIGIVENDFGDNLIVYPNPTEGKLSIDLGSIYGNSQILISDISGKIIESKTITQSQILNLSIEEPAGIYIVSIQAGDKKAVIRLIKK